MLQKMQLKEDPLVFYRFSDIQEKAMTGMKVIPSVFLPNMVTMEPSKTAKEFQYCEDDLPHPGTLNIFSKTKEGKERKEERKEKKKERKEKRKEKKRKRNLNK